LEKYEAMLPSTHIKNSSALAILAISHLISKKQSKLIGRGLVFKALNHQKSVLDRFCGFLAIMNMSNIFIDC